MTAIGETSPGSCTQEVGEERIEKVERCGEYKPGGVHGVE